MVTRKRGEIFLSYTTKLCRVEKSGFHPGVSLDVKMGDRVDKKTLMALLSSIVTILTISLTLLQIYSFVLIKIYQQRLQLQNAFREAILERNTALSRYHYFLCCMLQTTFREEMVSKFDIYKDYTHHLENK